MKKFRKGFTLLELLVVIGVMGILSSMAMIAGQQATDAARATNIADGLEKAAAAMMMYYSDNANVINEKGITTQEVIDGANAYLKTKFVAAGKKGFKTGTYSVALTAESKATATWYVAYTFLATDDSLKAIIANKATRMGLYSSAIAATKATEDNLYKATDDGAGNVTYPETVYMLVR